MAKSDKVKKILVQLAIIAIVLIVGLLVFFTQLGTFSVSSLPGSPCRPSLDYVCMNPKLSSNGSLAFTFEQNTSHTIYNLRLACVSTLKSDGLPANSSAWTLEASQLPNMQTVQITNLTCYNNYALPFATSSSPASAGEKFTGYILLNYTNNSPAPGNAQNPWYTTKIAVIVINVT
jgi:hypothetical protein